MSKSEQGSTHMDFRLSANGESLILTAPDGITVIDERSFGAITEDWSEGRFCDGESTFTLYETPTPGAPNCPVSLNEWREDELAVFPNPVSDMLFLPSVMPYELMDMTGRVIRKGQESQIMMSDLEAGVYILRAINGHAVIVVE